MEKTSKLTNFEKEYSYEISSYSVSEKELLATKINPKVLAYEVYLRKALGDSLAGKENGDDYDSKARRSVEKLSKDKLNNDELNSVIESIDNSEFDDNLDAIIHSKG